MDHHVPTIADPLTLRSGLTLPNRIAKAAMTENLADGDNQPTAELERVYRRWGEGGAGLLVTGNLMVDRRYLERTANVVADPLVDMDALARMAAATGDTPVLAQLNHPGRQCNMLVTLRPVAPSAGGAVRLLGAFAPPRALSDTEVDDVVDRYAEAAVRCEEAGFDGVQVHAAHGYLMAQFLSPRTNRRDDRWGGDLAGRARALLEAVRRVRAATSDGFTVAVKLNSSDFQDGGFQPEEAVQVARWLDDAGVDLVEVSGGTYESMAFLGGEVDGGAGTEKEAFFADVAGDVRAAVDVPVMLTGGIRSRAAAEALLDAGVTDVIGLARPLALDPDLPRRLLDGTADRIDLPDHDGVPALLSAAGESEWYETQIGRLGRAEGPDRDLDATRAALGFLAREAVRGLSGRLRRARLARQAEAARAA